MANFKGPLRGKTKFKMDLPSFLTGMSTGFTPYDKWAMGKSLSSSKFDFRLLSAQQSC